MTKLLYTLSSCAIAVACGVFGLCVQRWRQADPQLELFLQAPSAVQRSAESAGERAKEGVDTTSPLVAQAEVLASFLAPTRLTQTTEGDAMPPLVSPPERSELAPPVRPAAASVNFRLRATSCYPNEPGRSMALIAEPGVVEGQERWVREGTQIGHFVIHEIRRGVIVYRDGEQLREMAVERSTELPKIARDTRAGSPTARAATSMVESVLPILSEPDSAEIDGD